VPHRSLISCADVLHDGHFPAERLNDAPLRWIGSSRAGPEGSGMGSRDRCDDALRAAGARSLEQWIRTLAAGSRRTRLRPGGRWTDGGEPSVATGASSTSHATPLDGQIGSNTVPERQASTFPPRSRPGHVHAGARRDPTPSRRLSFVQSLAHSMLLTPVDGMRPGSGRRFNSITITLPGCPATSGRSSGRSV
jgi:hypothetical protein